MQATPDIMPNAIGAGQDCVEHVPFSVSVMVVYVVVCVSVAAVVSVVAVVNAASITNFEIDAHASISLYPLSFLSTSLTLTGLARLTRLPSLAGLTTRLATSTA